MRKRSVFFLAAVAAVLFSSAAVHAAARPPEIDWRTLETNYFHIHYNAKNDESARRLAGMADDIFLTLSQDLASVPEAKTHVVLVDYIDLSNGSATPTPYNTIEIWTTPPEPNSVLGDYDDWLRLVFIHELVHILHLDQALGPAKITRDLLGRSIIGMISGFPTPFLPFPNLTIPAWMIEGYATLDESRFTTAGRGDSNYSAMVLRMAVLDDAFFPIDKGSGPEGEWPGGSFRYLYGEAFLDYLADKHGVEAVNRMFRINALGLTPFLIEFPARIALDAFLQTEWGEWKTKLKSDAQAKLTRVKDGQETAPDKRTNSGWETRHPRVTANGKSIIHTVQNAWSYPHVSRLNLTTGETERLFDRNSHLGPAVPGPAGRYVYYAQLERFDKFNIYGDIYRFDLEQQRSERLTRGERTVSVDISPDGKRLAAIQNRINGQAVILYALEGDKAVPLRTLSSDRHRVYGTPRFSPDGSLLTYTSWSKGGFADIYVSDLQGNELRLTEDRYIDAAPFFTEDGEAIVFSSDRTGIYNLFSLPATGGSTPKMLTNVIGGLFESDRLPDGGFAAASYGGEGFNVATVAKAGFAPGEKNLQPDRAAYESRYPQTFTGPSRPYSPAQTLWPTSWTPSVYFSFIPGTEPIEGFYEVGLATGSRDVLGKHAYQAEAFYSRHLRRPGASASYTYDGLWPTISVVAESIPIEGSLVASRRASDLEMPGIQINGAGAGISIPFPNYKRGQQLSLSYVYSRDAEFGDLLHAGEPEVRRRGQAVLRWAYDSSQRYSIGIGPQHGTTLGLTHRLITPALGSSYKGALLLGDARQYWTLPYRQVIAIQGQAGVGQESEFFGPFVLGGNSGRLAIGDVGTLPLRGYLSGVQSGNKIAKSSVEYRFPLGLIKRGIPVWGTLPFLADQLHGAVFADAGSAWTQAIEPLASAGAELTFDFTVGYRIPLNAGLGAAWPIYPETGGPTLYFTLQQVAF